MWRKFSRNDRRAEVARILRREGLFSGVEKIVADELKISQSTAKSDIKALESGDAAKSAELEAPSEKAQEIYKMMLCGYKHSDIAEKFDVEVTDLPKIANICSGWDRRKKRFDISEIRQEQVRKLDAVSDMALEMFHDSRSMKRKTTTKESDEKGTEITVTEEERIGDPRFLTIYRDLQGDIRKVLGVDSPTKTAITNAEGDGPAEIVVKHMTQEEKMKLAEAHEVIEASFQRKDD